MPAEQVEQGSRVSSLLLLLLAVAAGSYWWLDQKDITVSQQAEAVVDWLSGKRHSEQLVWPPEPIERVKEPENTQIDAVHLVDINFWEARLKTTYSLQSRYRRGYVAFNMVGQSWSHTIGLVTRPGTHTGDALLGRNADRESSYTVEKIHGRMYDPYRNDRAYFEQDYDIALNWPGEDSLEITRGPDYRKFRDIKRVYIYRNVPRYIDFAEHLVEEGFLAERVQMQLAVCGGCAASLIFGDDVSVDALQTVLRVLKQQNYPIDRVELSTHSRDIGVIRIGQSPNDRAKPLWSKVETLLNPDISEELFFAALGFEKESDHTRAVALHKKAKNLIDHYGHKSKKMAEARSLLGQAQELDSDYMPIYIELSRYLMRGGSGFSASVPTEQGHKAKAVLQNALKLDPEYSHSYVLLGYVQTALQEYDDAQESFEKAEALGATSVWLYNNKAAWYQSQGEDGEALEEQVKVLSHNLDDSDNDRALKYGLSELATRYIKLERFGDARAIFERHRKDFPADMRGLENHIMFLLAHTSDMARIEELFQVVKQRNCYCYPKVTAMIEVVRAAQKVGLSTSEVVKGLIAAQSTRTSFSQVIAQLGRGLEGRKALDKLFESDLEMMQIESTESVLFSLISSEDYISIQFFLKYGANPNKIDRRSGLPPLAHAVALNDIILARLLLTYGADPALEGPAGYSAYDLAREMDKQEMVDILLGKQI